MIKLLIFELDHALFQESDPAHGVEEFLSNWPNSLAAVSDLGEAQAQELLFTSPLKGFKWLKLVGRDSLPYRRPHPETFLEICRAASVAPSHALVIAASMDNLASASHAGIKSVAVNFQSHPLSELIQSSAHAVLNDYRELQQIIAAFGGH